MPTVYSQLAGREVDTESEEWRHECECRWLLRAKPTRTEKHVWLYGVRDRSMVVRHDPATGQDVYLENWRQITGGLKSIASVRNLASADRMLADAKRLYEIAQQAAEPAA